MSHGLDLLETNLGDVLMDERILFFLRDNLEALPLYQKFEECVCSAIENVIIKTKKTQISFYNRHMFGCVSFTKVRKKSLRPDCYIVITFGLDHEIQSPRIDVATEVRPNRCTHHVLISDPSEIDDELMGWVKAASIFSDAKR